MVRLFFFFLFSLPLFWGRLAEYVRLISFFARSLFLYPTFAGRRMRGGAGRWRRRSGPRQSSGLPPRRRVAVDDKCSASFRLSSSVCKHSRNCLIFRSYCHSPARCSLQAAILQRGDVMKDWATNEAKVSAPRVAALQR